MGGNTPYVDTGYSSSHPQYIYNITHTNSNPFVSGSMGSVLLLFIVTVNLQLLSLCFSYKN